MANPSPNRHIARPFTNWQNLQPWLLRKAGNHACCCRPCNHCNSTVAHPIVGIGDGVRQPWETPLAGIAITLNGEMVLTDENGRFLFINIAPGSYGVTAVLPDGLSAVIDNAHDDLLLCNHGHCLWKTTAMSKSHV